MLMRVFTGRVRAGMATAYERLLHDHAVPTFRAVPGFIAVHLGLPDDETPDRFMVETLWRDLDALKRFTGDDWRHAKLSSSERELLRESTVYHFRAGDDVCRRPMPRRAPIDALPEILELDRLEIDLVREIVYLDGRAIELPPREFALLRELALEPDEPIPALELARRLWPGGPSSSAYDVRRAVYRLRRLLRDHHRKSPLIRNRRGYGYLLQARRRSR